MWVRIPPTPLMKFQKGEIIEIRFKKSKGKIDQAYVCMVTKPNHFGKPMVVEIERRIYTNHWQRNMEQETFPLHLNEWDIVSHGVSDTLWSSWELRGLLEYETDS